MNAEKRKEGPKAVYANGMPVQKGDIITCIRKGAYGITRFLSACVVVEIFESDRIVGVLSSRDNFYYDVVSEVFAPARDKIIVELAIKENYGIDELEEEDKKLLDDLFKKEYSEYGNIARLRTSDIIKEKIKRYGIKDFNY